MTPAELAAALAKLGLTPKQAAPRLFCSARLVHYMLTGDRPIMPRTVRLLNVLLDEDAYPDLVEALRLAREYVVEQILDVRDGNIPPDPMDTAQADLDRIDGALAKSTAAYLEIKRRARITRRTRAA